MNTRSESNREQSVGTLSIKIRVNTIGAYKYCVLFVDIFCLKTSMNTHLIIKIHELTFSKVNAFIMHIILANKTKVFILFEVDTECCEEDF